MKNKDVMFSQLLFEQPFTLHIGLCLPFGYNNRDDIEFCNSKSAIKMMKSFYVTESHLHGHLARKGIELKAVTEVEKIKFDDDELELSISHDIESHTDYNMIILFMKINKIVFPVLFKRLTDQSDHISAPSKYKFREVLKI